MGTIGGKANRGFVDMDYSYERMTLVDRLLDMNPTPPPYADTLIRWDLDALPQVPVPQFTYDAYEDPTKEDKDEGEGNDKPKDGEPSKENEMTKEEWEAQYKKDDGTYSTPTELTDFWLFFGLGDDPNEKVVMSEPVWNYVQNFLMFEQNYSFPNSIIGPETPVRVDKWNNGSGKVYYRLILEYPAKSGKDSWFTIPISTYDPRDNEGNVPAPDPENEDVPKEDPSGNWKTDNTDANTGYYNLPLSEGEEIKTVEAYPPYKDGMQRDPVWTADMLYGPYDPMTVWMLNYFQFVLNDDTLKNEMNGAQSYKWTLYWAFITQEQSDGTNVAYLQIFYEQPNWTGAKNINRASKISLGTTSIHDVNGRSYKGELFTQLQPKKDTTGTSTEGGGDGKADESTWESTYQKVDPKTGTESFRLPVEAFFPAETESAKRKLSDTEWQWLMNYMTYSNSYYYYGTAGSLGYIIPIEKNDLKPVSREALFGISYGTKDPKFMNVYSTNPETKEVFSLTIPLQYIPDFSNEPYQPIPFPY